MQQTSRQEEETRAGGTGGKEEKVVSPCLALCDDDDDDDEIVRLVWREERPLPFPLFVCSFLPEEGAPGERWRVLPHMRISRPPERPTAGHVA